MDMTTKEQVKVLWRQCFEDNESFVDLYFKKRYSDDINAVIEQDGSMVSSLQYLQRGPFRIWASWKAQEAGSTNSVYVHLMV